MAVHTSFFLIFILLPSVLCFDDGWHTLRPNLYYGLRKPSNLSPLFGIGWYSIDSSTVNIRHSCQESDNLNRYSWMQHDGDVFGTQELIDGRIKLTTSFLSVEKEKWISRISAKHATSPHGTVNVSLIWYLAIQDPSDSLSIDGDTIHLTSNNEEYLLQPVGDELNHPWIPQLPSKRKKKTPRKLMHLDGFYYRGVSLPAGQQWSVIERDFIPFLASSETAMRKKYANQKNVKLFPRLNNTIVDKPNVIVVQTFLTAPFSIDLQFGFNEPKPIEETTNQLLLHSDSFITKFDSSFQLSSTEFNSKHLRMARAAFSNLIGGIGYFSGKSQVLENNKRTWAPESELLASVPSRSFFPRGFLWDEGFHQILVSRFDLSLSMKIIESWLKLIDDNGWVAREQILGSEARSRVPEKFRVQEKHIANPPTLFLALDTILDSFNTQADITVGGDIQSRSSQIHSFLLRWFSTLKRHVDWYFRTQAGSYRQNSFRWTGRTRDHCLSSGLDDYPRAKWLTPNEGHVDLHSWMLLLVRIMSRISTMLDQPQDADLFTSRSADIYTNLIKFHWDSDSKSFCDYARNDTSMHVQLVCHFGYVSLLPFALKLLPPDSVQLRHTLEKLADPRLVWSKYGIRSLSISDLAEYGGGDDYWRGAIWLNINYLCLSALHHYSITPGPEAANAQKLFTSLRRNLIDNISKEFFNTGYFWEQYSSSNGKGRRSHPFTGWTSLVVAIMSNKF